MPAQPCLVWEMGQGGRGGGQERAARAVPHHPQLPSDLEPTITPLPHGWSKLLFRYFKKTTLGGGIYTRRSSLTTFVQNPPVHKYQDAPISWCFVLSSPSCFSFLTPACIEPHRKSVITRGNSVINTERILYLQKQGLAEYLAWPSPPIPIPSSILQALFFFPWGWEDTPDPASCTSAVGILNKLNFPPLFPLPPSAQRASVQTAHQLPTGISALCQLCKNKRIWADPPQSYPGSLCCLGTTCLQVGEEPARALGKVHSACCWDVKGLGLCLLSTQLSQEGKKGFNREALTVFESLQICPSPAGQCLLSGILLAPQQPPRALSRESLWDAGVYLNHLPQERCCLNCNQGSQK